MGRGGGAWRDWDGDGEVGSRCGGRVITRWGNWWSVAPQRQLVAARASESNFARVNFSLLSGITATCTALPFTLVVPNHIRGSARIKWWYHPPSPAPLPLPVHVRCHFSPITQIVGIETPLEITTSTSRPSRATIPNPLPPLHPPFFPIRRHSYRPSSRLPGRRSDTR